MLDLLLTKPIQPGAVAAFPKAFTRFANAAANSQEEAWTRLNAERAAASRKRDGLYDAIADGLRTPRLQARLEELEARISELDTELAAHALAPVRFNPNLSDLYHKKVSDLGATMANPDIRTEALESVRGLIERVAVGHENGQVTVALEGALAAMIFLAQDAKRPSKEGHDGNTFEFSLKVVAGACSRRNLPNPNCFV